MMARAALRVVEHNAVTFRRIWRSSLTSIVMPFVFLAAMGLGLGSLVSRQTGTVGGVTYLAFLAPGLLVATAMQTGAGDGAWPVMAKMRWNRVYHAMLATPLTVDDLLLGELAWTALRLIYLSAAFFAAMLLFGVVLSPWGFLAVPVAVLTGLAFYTPILALTGAIRTDSPYNVVFRVGITPLFVLGGAFFPIERLPAAVQPVAWAMPLSHGVALARGLTTGAAEPVMALVHVVVLAAFALVGLAAARVTFQRQMLR
jgi:lipooligosaccharide transport system permease protein